MGKKKNKACSQVSREHNNKKNGSDKNIVSRKSTSDFTPTVTPSKSLNSRKRAFSHSKDWSRMREGSVKKHAGGNWTSSQVSTENSNCGYFGGASGRGFVNRRHAGDYYSEWETPGFGGYKNFQVWQGGFGGYGEHVGGYVWSGHNYHQPSFHQEYNNYQTDREIAENENSSFDRNADKRKSVAEKDRKINTNSRRQEKNTDKIKKENKERKQITVELAKDLEDRNEIADKAAKIKAALGSLDKTTSSCPEYHRQKFKNPLYSQEESGYSGVSWVKIDKNRVPDLALSANDLGEIGREKNLSESNEEETDADLGHNSRPSILPAFHDELVVAPPSSTTNSSSTFNLFKPRVPAPGLANIQPRKRSMSDSLSIPEPAKKKSQIFQYGNTSSELHSVDEAMGQIIDKQRVEKLKKSLVNMDKKSLNELINNPTSSNSKLLMSFLVKEHKSFISNCLNRARFSRVEAEDNVKQNETVEEDLTVLSNELMVEISNFIKLEVPEVVDEESVTQPLLDVKCEVDDQEQHLMISSNIKQKFGAVNIKAGPGPPAQYSQSNFCNGSQREVASTSKSKSKTKVRESAVPIDKDTRLAPEYKKRGRPCKGIGRQIGGEEVVIGTIGDLVNVGGYESSETDNQTETHTVEEEEVPENDASSDKMKSLGLIFEQESRLLSDLEVVDSKMSSLVNERTSLMQQILFLSELKRQMFKQ